MASKGQKFRTHSNDFKLYIVQLRIKKGYSLRSVCRIYSLSSENVIKWTRRYLNGEPLTMKRGRQKKKPLPANISKITPLNLEEQLEQLKAELAYKDEVIKHLEKREHLKKKKNSKSSES